MRPLEIFFALGFLLFIGSSIASVISDLMSPAPMSSEALAHWAILACIAAVGLWALAHFFLEGWVRRLKNRPEIHKVREEVLSLLPAYLAPYARKEAGQALWLLYTPRGPSLRTKTPGATLPGPKVPLSEETRKDLVRVIHKARRRVYGSIAARVLQYGESLFELPPPSNHQVMEAIARARRSS